MHILIIDNYDSFTYNLYQFIGETLIRAQKQNRIDRFLLTVKRNNEITLEQIQQLNPDRIIISPGPGHCDDDGYFGICMQVIQQLGKKIPILGVCLGMQGIVSAFGGKVVKAANLVHGKTDNITHTEKGLFIGLPQPLSVMRYHSLIADKASLPDCLAVTAELVKEGIEYIMAVQHREYPIYGIQFHPESYATEAGKEIITHFLL